jgi:glucose-6-phosphate 1-dehydrogenase
MKLLIDNWRWADVPFYLRTGKHLPRRVTEIAIQFKRAPFVLFRDTPVEHLSPNRLVMHIRRRKGSRLRFGAKVPGPHVHLGSVSMDFSTRTTSARPEHRVRTAALRRDGGRRDAVSARRHGRSRWAWWRRSSTCGRRWRRVTFRTTRLGTWGPAQADELLKRDGRQWREIKNGKEISS